MDFMEDWREITVVELPMQCLSKTIFIGIDNLSTAIKDIEGNILTMGWGKIIQDNVHHITSAILNSCAFTMWGKWIWDSLYFLSEHLKFKKIFLKSSLLKCFSYIKKVLKISLAINHIKD